MRTLDPDTFGSASPCFGCAPRHPIGLHLRFETDGTEVVTRFVPGEQYQGPPGVMHGGLVLTLADELASWTVIGLRERFGFTASVEARLLRPVRIGVEVEGRGRITADKRRVLTVGTTLTQAGADVFRGDFVFALLDRAGAERLLGGPLPDPWVPFAR